MTDWPTAELALARERVQELERECERIQDRNHWLALSLAKLCQYLDKHGGYMSAGNQRALREAKSLLADLEGGPLPPQRAPRVVYKAPEHPRWLFERDPAAAERAPDALVPVTTEHGQGTPKLSATVTIEWPETVAELVYDSLPDREPRADRPRTSSPLRPAEASAMLDAAIVRMLDTYDRVAARATHCAICRVRSKNAKPFVPLLAGESVVAVCTSCVKERRALDGSRPRRTA